MLQVLSHIERCYEAFCDNKGTQKRYAGEDNLISNKILIRSAHTRASIDPAVQAQEVKVPLICDE